MHRQAALHPGPTEDVGHACRQGRFGVVTEVGGGAPLFDLFAVVPQREAHIGAAHGVATQAFQAVRVFRAL